MSDIVSNQSLEEALHDPNISFDEYIQLLMEREYLFDDDTYELDG
jgi:hypothetical protein